jgi:gamma-glutamyltranspeptidase/glutathione hydrolase
MRAKQRRIFNSILAVVVLFGLAGFYSSQGLAWQDLLPLKSSVTHGAAAQTPVGGYGVSAAHPLAVEAGMEILERGGNAVDAAVAVSYVLAVVEPYASGIGGGGAALVFPAGSTRPQVYDYREAAPLSGRMPGSFAGVPGFVAGMDRMHREHGRLEMEEVLEPALRLAEEGYAANQSLSDRLEANRYYLPVRSLPHFYPYGMPVRPGDKVRQLELAATIRAIRDGGPDAFYQGEIAAAIAAGSGGLSLEDMRGYSVIKAEPASAAFGGYTVYTAPAPMGGIALLQVLQMAELLQLEQHLPGSAAYIDLLTSMIKRSYYDRRENIGDPRYIYVPAEELTSREYARKMALEISADRFGGRLDDFIIEDTPADFEDHDNTTHFVIVDKEGTMVSATNTISQFFGSGVYVKGFFLNNQLKNFSTSAGSPNLIEPGKRARSYISPTILAEDGRPVLGIGTPGGNKIPMAIVQAILQLTRYGLPLDEAIAAPRFFIEDKSVIYLEKDLPAAEKEALRARGYTVIIYDAPMAYGGLYAIHIDYENDRIYAVADPRRSGTASVNN